MAGRRGFVYTTYILKNSASGRFYVGSTNDLTRRLSEHNRGHNRSTRSRGVWMLVYSEELNTGVESRQRERQIKAYKGGNGFKKLISGISSPVE